MKWKKPGELEKLILHRDTLLAYLHSSVQMQEWHSVRDAAADLEVIEARIKERETRRR